MAKHVRLMFDDDFKDKEREVLDKLIDLQKALIHKDLETLNNLFDDSFVLIRGSGREETKYEFLTDIKEDI